MEMSESINELATALSLAQAEINNPTKNAANPFFKSRYSDLAEVLGVVRPAFSAHGLAVMQHPSIEAGIVKVTTIITHSSGQWAKSAISASAGKNIQESGSAITYCRRYALSAIAGVSQEDDDVNGAIKGKNADTQQVKETAKEVSSYWEKEADKNCNTVEELGRWYKDSLPKINKMDKQEIAKINRYVGQLKALAMEKETPKTDEIICPQTNSPITMSCDGRECRKGCPAYPINSKLDLGGLE